MFRSSRKTRPAAKHDPSGYRIDSTTTTKYPVEKSRDYITLHMNASRILSTGEFIKFGLVKPC